MTFLEAWGGLILAGLVGLGVGLPVWVRRPDARQNLLLRGLLFVSGAALVFVAIVAGMLVAILLAMPDMSEF